MPVKHKNISFEEVIEELEPHEKVIKFAVVVSAFLFVWFSVVYSSNIAAAFDSDGDGFSDVVENFIGTNANVGCGVNAWPPDLNSDQTVNQADVDMFKSHFNSSLGSPAYSARFDLNSDNKVTLSDVLLLNPYFGKSCQLAGGGGVQIPQGDIAPWSILDIGNPASGGQEKVGDANYNIWGGGADIWGTSDSFRFAYQQKSGDIMLTAKINSLDNTNEWAKAGIMLRSGTEANSPYFFVFVTPGTNGAVVQYRGASGYYAWHHTQNSGNQVPKWLRITKYNNSYRAYISDDGQNFSPLGKPVLFPMNSNYLAGMAVTSHKSGTLAKAAFRNIALGNPPTAIYPSMEFNVDAYTYTGPGGNAGTGIGWTANAFDCFGASRPDGNLWGGFKQATGVTVVYPTQDSIFDITCYGGNEQINRTRSTYIKPICGGGTSDGLKNGELYQGSGQEMWVIENCQKRHIVSPEVFLNICMYDPSKVKPTQDRYLNVIGTGSPVSSAPCPPAPKLPLPCTGTPAMTLSTLSVEQNGTVNALISGLSNCSSVDKIYINKATGIVWDLNYLGLGCTISGSGCQASFTASFAPGTYAVRALLDRGGNGSIENVSNQMLLTVNAPPSSSPPPPPITGDPGKDAIREYIKSYVGGWNVRRTIGGYNLNFGRFLWGLAGCESGWNPSEQAGFPYYEKGLFQYQSSTWTSTINDARSRGYNVGDDIWNYEHQVQVTVWKVSPNGGGDYPQAWTCWNNWFSGGRNWTWFTDEWPDPNF